MDWITDAWEWFTGSGASGVSDAASSASNSSSFVDLLSSVGTTISDVYESLSSTFDKTGADYADADTGAAIRATKMATDSSPSLLDKVGGFYKKNKGLVDLVGSGIASYQQNENKEEAAAKLAQSRLNELREKDRIDQENNARFSQSVSSLRPVGLINSQQKLKRVGGANVFNNTGGLIRG